MILVAGKRNGFILLVTASCIISSCRCSGFVSVACPFVRVDLIRLPTTGVNIELKSIQVHLGCLGEKADPNQVQHWDGENETEDCHAPQFRVHDSLIFLIQFCHLFSRHVSYFEKAEVFLLFGFLEEEGRLHLGLRHFLDHGSLRRRSRRRKRRYGKTGQKEGKPTQVHHSSSFSDWQK